MQGGAAERRARGIPAGTPAGTPTGVAAPPEPHAGSGRPRGAVTGAGGAGAAGGTLCGGAAFPGGPDRERDKMAAPGGGAKMAAPMGAVPGGGPGDGPGGAPRGPPPGTPRHVRDLLGRGIAARSPPSPRKDPPEPPESPNGCSQTENPWNSLECASREAYLSRVETFTPQRWAGKPRSLSPLACARLGWASVGPDLLRCCACRASLGARLGLPGDTQTYRERCAELERSLRSAHERFCFWPDSPCPDRFALLLVDEPQVLLQEFRERFRSLCPLELQLPSLRPEDLKAMALSEERLELLLELLRDGAEGADPGGKESLEKGADPGGKESLEALPAHAVPACVLALCGWSGSAGPVALPVISCSRCMRRVGLWAFQQLESAAPEPECGGSGGSERVPPAPTSPRRMLTRSRDMLPTGAEQEKSPSPSVCRARGRDSPNSTEQAEQEVSSPSLRSRPVTRSMGQGDTMEVPSSPARRAKRARLCSSSSSDNSMRSFFHPCSQHRDWCPWVSTAEGQESLEDTENPGKAEPGWQVVLNTLLGTLRDDPVPDTEPVSLSEKSCKVFRIFRQWESMNSS
ncbi:zinc finger C3HC-type protein 1 isoform X2 [Pithys albifrons albifrons]|uniref:zinc finger C3HC-type protein 1 isoform X2 n=1 Tax=Pithys albifrons albifrons TaxID=3385563 RepID=UPI003A5CB631